MTDPSSYRQHRAAASPIVAAVAVVTLSDTRTAETDVSGRRAIELLAGAGHRALDHRVLPDDPAALAAAMDELLGRPDVDAVLTTGGTGVGRRDQTIGVVERLLDVPLPGFGELFRMLSWEQVGSGAMLSRAVGGVARGKVVFAMPGSPAAVELAVTRLILPELPHLLRELRR
jgi:molybdenum cofactor biosynthesis protein B